MNPSLFTAEELTRQLQYGPDDAIAVADAAQTELVVAGWLSEATDITDVWPTGTDDKVLQVLRAWGIELGGIAYENPTSMERDQSGDISSGWWDRRRQILEQARAWAVRNGYRRADSAPPRSRGCFPKAQPMPDPAIPRGHW